MSNKRYAVIAKMRKQVSGFVNNQDSVNLKNNILVDMFKHPQRDIIEKNWFYDEESNIFSEQGEIVYPIAELVLEEPTQLDRIESMVAKSQEEIAQEARDAYTLELIEGGVIA